MVHLIGLLLHNSNKAVSSSDFTKSKCFAIYIVFIVAMIVVKLVHIELASSHSTILFTVTMLVLLTQPFLVTNKNGDKMD